MKKLRDVLPREFFAEHSESPAARFLDVDVIGQNDHGEYWPGPHVHVYCFWKLANGYLVGWNENPARGWSFPVTKKPVQVS